MGTGRLPALRAAVPRHRLRGDGCLSLLVHADEVQVVVRDLRGRLLALEPFLEESLQRVPPDRASDGEAHEALHRRCLAQPVLDLLRGGASPEQHAYDAVAAAGAALASERLGVRLLVDALDLPDVGLDARVL